MTDNEDERALVARAQKDPAAFGEIFDTHYDRILAYALKRTFNADLAADITAETFMKAMRGLPLFKWRGIPILAWLYRIAGNEIKMYFRKGAYAPTSLSELMEEGFDPESEPIRSEKQLMDEMVKEDAEMKRVHEVLREMPNKYQEVIALRFFSELSTGEIARVVNKPEGTVRSLLSRGLAELREKIAVQQTPVPRIIESEGRPLEAKTQNV